MTIFQKTQVNGDNEDPIYTFLKVRLNVLPIKKQVKGISKKSGVKDFILVTYLSSCFFCFQMEYFFESLYLKLGEY